MTADKPTPVPRLRFPEFQDGPDWKTGRCRDIAKVLPGYGFPDKFQGNKKGQYPFYKVSDISHTIEKGQRYISEANNYIDSDVLETIRAQSVPPGTIIFAKIGEAIRSNRRVITIKPAVIDNNTAGVKAIRAKSSDEFLFYLWGNVSLSDYASGVVPAVSKSALENVSLCYPGDPAEQRRIADCLGSLDDVIAAQVGKLEVLREHKQGLMQQLFPQPGEIVPHLRFPEFQDGPDWTQARCRDVAKVVTGYGFPEKFQGSKNGQYPFYKVSDISHAVEKGEKFVVEANNYIDADVLSEIQARLVPTGTIIFAKIGEAIRSNRRAIVTKSAVIDNNTAGISAMKEKVSGAFLFYLWSNVSLIEYASGVVPAVNKSALENVPLCYPKDREEQQRISNCLSVLDTQICAHLRKLSTFKRHKRGLLQQVFPSLEGP